MKLTLPALAAAIGLSGSAFAGEPCPPAPGEILGATINTAADRNQRYFRAGEFNYALVPVTTLRGNGERLYGYAIVPVEDALGRPLNPGQAATMMWRTGRHFGAYDTKGHAIEHAATLEGYGDRN